MIVFLLILIAAILFFGAGAFLRFGAAAVRVGLLLTVIALIIGVITKVPALALISTVVVLMLGGTGAFYLIVLRADEDAALLASEEGRKMRASGHSAQQTVEVLRRGGAVSPPPLPTAEVTPIQQPPHNHEAWAAPRPADGPRQLIQDDLMLSARIEYLDASGEITTRKVDFHSAYGRNGVVDRLDGWCSRRRAERSFMLAGILSLTDLDTGETWSDAWDWFDERRYDDPPYDET